VSAAFLLLLRRCRQTRHHADGSECKQSELEDIGPLHGAAYLEAMKGAKRSVATQKQHMAAVRMLFDYLVTGGILAHNPILSVRAPQQSVTKGKTPTLSAEDAGELLRAIETIHLQLRLLVRPGERPAGVDPRPADEGEGPDRALGRLAQLAAEGARAAHVG
jgi:hypothetical protein